MNPVISKDRHKFWRNEEGRHHRKDGPAIEWCDDSKEWFIDGERHRENGPAIEWGNGSKWWYYHGQRHREDGPAIEWSDGDKEWYYHDEKIYCSSQEEFEKIIKLRMFW